MKLACCAPWIKEQGTRLDFFRSWKKEHGIIMLDPVKCVIVSADGFIKKNISVNISTINHQKRRLGQIWKKRAISLYKRMHIDHALPFS